MGLVRPHLVVHASVLYRWFLAVAAYITGLLAVGLTLAAFLAPHAAQTPIERIRSPAPSSVDWTQFGFDTSATRNNPAETRITAHNVSALRLMWRSKLPDIADSTPAFLHGLRFPGGRLRNVLYLTTRSGSLVALDADSGALLWQRSNPTFDPNKLTTSSPFADASRGVVYSYGLDGKVHKYNAISGQEQFTSGWPVLVTTMRNTEKGSSALMSANGYLYVTTSSWGGDAPPYQGHLVIIDLATATTRIFNSLCSNVEHLLAPGECKDNGAGIWGRPGAVVDPNTGNIFIATANGPYTADKGGHDWGDSVLELTQDGSRLLDAYTPQKQNSLYTQDLDLGSAAPALLPALPASTTPFLLVQASKDGLLRLLNRQNLSGQRGPGHVGGELQTTETPGHCAVLTQPAIWTDLADGTIWVFVASGCAIGAYRVKVMPDRSAALVPVWNAPVGATSPVIAGGVLYAATTGTKEILALDLRTGHRLWTSRGAHVGGSIGYTHWESPIVVNGRLYCTDEDRGLVAYGLEST
jgi:outer membrane protein assembly factor BamB